MPCYQHAFSHVVQRCVGVAFDSLVQVFLYPFAWLERVDQMTGVKYLGSPPCVGVVGLTQTNLFFALRVIVQNFVRLVQRYPRSNCRSIFGHLGTLPSGRDAQKVILSGEKRYLSAR